MIAALVAPLVLLGGLTGQAVGGSTVGAADPPRSWSNERLLACDEGIVRTYLTPAGFGSAFHVVGSNEVIVPMYVEVVLPNGEGPFVTRYVRGFDPDEEGAVHCWYVDPIGLAVEFWGLRR